MNSVGIITDSHSGILQTEAKQKEILVLPMPFYCEEECYYEGISITREEFFEKLRSGKHVSTSQPSPEEVMEIWQKGLEMHDEVVYIPLSSGLSGSCSTAQILAQQPEFEGKVFVVDNGRVSATMHCSVLDALELAAQGCSGAEIKQRLEDARDKAIIYIGLETLENLKRGGRVSSTTAALGAMLNIKPVMRFNTGLLEPYKKCRGMKKARREMLEAMKQEFATTFREEVERKEVQLVAASSADDAVTESWVKEIREFFPDMEVLCEPLPMGLCCHIGEGGLGIGCSCKP